MPSKPSKPNKDKTEIAIVLDRSGSMVSIREDMEGGFRAFVAEQREQPGQCVLSLYQFDGEYEAVYEAKPLSKVRGLKLVPRGSTALLDGVGRSIANIAERHDALPAAERPAAVIVLVITDGHENASTEWTLARVRKAVTNAEKERNWRFVFLGADPQAFADAHNMGFDVAAQYDARSVRHAYSSVASSASRYRNQIREGCLDATFSLEMDLTSGSGESPKV